MKDQVQPIHGKAHKLENFQVCENYLAHDIQTITVNLLVL